MSQAITEMALGYYGHGRWSAPYWFIGPEQGQDRGEICENRVRAWLELGGGELNDCPQYHKQIGVTIWHSIQPKAKLQPTWRPLILLLMHALERHSENESLRKYQREQWGTTTGETCVIELSGLAAHNLNEPRNRERFRKQRIEVIRQRICENNPKIIVMYGREQKEAWSEIAGNAFPPDNILRVGSTIFALTPHPVSRLWTNLRWSELGDELKKNLRHSF